jgi:hypothetical protein
VAANPQEDRGPGGGMRLAADRRMRTISTGSLLAVLLLAGCVGFGSSSQAVSGSDDDLDPPVAHPEDVDYDGEDCVKIENEQIGTDLTLDVGDVQVAVHSWVSKAGEPDEFRGFSYTSDSGIVFRVKAGGELFFGSTSPWENPNGEGGSDVSAVSNVVFCPPPPGGGGDSDGGVVAQPDAGVTDCNDPDGCDAGSGGGPVIP